MSAGIALSTDQVRESGSAAVRLTGRMGDVRGIRVAVAADIGDAGAARLLAAGESADLGRLAAAARPGRLTGRLLFAHLLDDLCGAGVARPPVSAVCGICGGPHGIPRAEGFALSASHSAGWTAVAIVRTCSEGGLPAGSGSIGIDIERLDESSSAAERESRVAALSTVLGAPLPDLRSALTRWTAVEAVLKADGRGLEVDPSRVVLTASSSVDGIVEARIEGVEGAVFEVDRVEAGPELIISVARRVDGRSAVDGQF